MSDLSENLSLRFMQASREDKEAIFNELVRLLDILVQGAVEGISRDTPPGAPTNGQAWIVNANGVSTSATGVWATHDGEVAYYYDGWTYIDPPIGTLLYDKETGQPYRKGTGNVWTAQALVNIGLSYSGQGLPANSVIAQFVFPSDLNATLKVGAQGSRGYAILPPADTADTSLEVYKNTTLIGRVRWVPGNEVPTFTGFATATSFAPGDRLSLRTSAAIDENLGDIAITMALTRTN